MYLYLLLKKREKQDTWGIILRYLHPLHGKGGRQFNRHKLIFDMYRIVMSPPWSWDLQGESWCWKYQIKLIYWKLHSWFLNLEPQTHLSVIKANAFIPVENMYINMVMPQQWYNVVLNITLFFIYFILLRIILIIIIIATLKSNF